MSVRKPVYYGGYLQLDKLLSAQKPLSGNGQQAAHDEMLFIITHQAYELWFKQIIHELDSVLEDFSGKLVPESAVSRAVARLSRVVEIQKLLVDQLRVLETMTPLDFLDFRDALTPASGFQSFQFRLIEQKLGLIDERRTPFEKSPYFARLAPEHRRLVLAAGKADSLFVLVERWLERTPFTRLGGFDFWREYRKAVGAMLTATSARSAPTPRWRPRTASGSSRRSRARGRASTPCSTPSGTRCSCAKAPGGCPTRRRSPPCSSSCTATGPSCTSPSASSRSSSRWTSSSRCGARATR